MSMSDVIYSLLERFLTIKSGWNGAGDLDERICKRIGPVQKMVMMMALKFAL